jgi:peptidoglycan/xylan/chitin deacetylase (PgdA/CDA1 family)
VICLTGDIHHSGFRYREFPNPRLEDLPPPRRPYVALSEAEVTREYLDIAREAGLKVTLFVTGLAVRRDWAAVRALAGDDVEVGGHTYRAFQPLRLHDWFKRLAGSFYGPRWFQRWDVERTLVVIRRRLGTPAVSWRTHAYASDATTRRVLEHLGVRVLSDRVDLGALGPSPLTAGLVALPINVLPDHEHLYHAERTPSALAAARTARAVYHAGEWLTEVKRQVDAVEQRGGVATLLVHPLCMFTLDRFQTFRALCRFLSGRQSLLGREAAAVQAPGAPPRR